MNVTQTVLVTGANRGIGRAFTSAYLDRPSTTVIAAVRDTAKESSKSLHSLPKAIGSRLILVKVDSAIHSDAAEAVNKVQTDFEIDSLDVVIANAGISHSGTSILHMSVVSATQHFKINSLGPVTLLQATVPLLRASKLGHPKFVAISSNVGTIGGADSLRDVPPVLSPCGASKAALNWFIKRLHAEEEWVISFAFHPGLVLTELAQRTFTSAGVSLKGTEAISVEESVQGMIETIDSASQDTSGTFRGYASRVLPW
ncbi:hypothetical protein BKA59DRAFT_400186 [Fusarium tricinctum]|jgi:norsolorinic acid ketoreductase|uniref:Ketoreductase n=1 Tax=Fusarium tricinctum TaxID=61284 RepID=A0A8K0RTM0_9HYPO|nr:hypothetical protein BKA59DRAFT_400186 [Fusarium tricinctum]